MVPGIERCKDGYVGLATITVQQWHDVLAMMARPDLVERTNGTISGPVSATGRKLRRDASMAHGAHGRRDTRVGCRVSRPRRSCWNGANVTDCRIWSAGALPPNPEVVSPIHGRRFERLGPHRRRHEPRRASESTTPRASMPAVDPGPWSAVHVVGATHRRSRGSGSLTSPPFGRAPSRRSTSPPSAPTSSRSSPPNGPTHAFQRERADDDRPMVRTGLVVSLCKSQQAGADLDLTQSRGREFLLGLVATADVVIENFTPRVMDQFGLTYDALRSVRPDLVYLRMPGWGLEGPWRDWPAFASTMEQISGMAWITGWRDGPPMLAGICDALAQLLTRLTATNWTTTPTAGR